jgi:hypothetical protein
MLSPTTIMRRNAIYKGLLGGSRGWLYVGGAVWVLHVVRRTLGRAETIAAVEVLRPGQGLVLRTIVPATSQQRKVARKAK